MRGRKPLPDGERLIFVHIGVKEAIVNELGGEDAVKQALALMINKLRTKPKAEPKEKPVKPTLEQLPDNCFAVKTGNGWDYSTYYGEPGKLNDFLSINKKDLIEAAGNESNLNAILKDFWKAKTFGNERYTNYGAFRKNLINYILARKNKTLTNGTEPKRSKVESIVNNFTAAQEAIKAKYGQ